MRTYKSKDRSLFDTGLEILLLAERERSEAVKEEAKIGVQYENEEEKPDA
jgi:hypothetical protein